MSTVQQARFPRLFKQANYGVDESGDFWANASPDKFTRTTFEACWKIVIDETCKHLHWRLMHLIKIFVQRNRHCSLKKFLERAKVKTLADFFKTNERAVQRAIEQLKELGFLEASSVVKCMVVVEGMADNSLKHEYNQPCIHTGEKQTRVRKATSVTAPPAKPAKAPVKRARKAVAARTPVLRSVTPLPVEEPITRAHSAFDDVAIGESQKKVHAQNQTLLNRWRDEDDRAEAKARAERAEKNRSHTMNVTLKSKKIVVRLPQKSAKKVVAETPSRSRADRLRDMAENAEAPSHAAMETLRFLTRKLSGESSSTPELSRSEKLAEIREYAGLTRRGVAAVRTLLQKFSPEDSSEMVSVEIASPTAQCQGGFHLARFSTRFPMVTTDDVLPKKKRVVKVSRKFLEWMETERQAEELAQAIIRMYSEKEETPEEEAPKKVEKTARKDALSMVTRIAETKPVSNPLASWEKRLSDRYWEAPRDWMGRASWYVKVLGLNEYQMEAAEKLYKSIVGETISTFCTSFPTL